MQPVAVDWETPPAAALPERNSCAEVPLRRRDVRGVAAMQWAGGAARGLPLELIMQLVAFAASLFHVLSQPARMMSLLSLFG